MEHTKGVWEYFYFNRCYGVVVDGSGDIAHCLPEFNSKRTQKETKANAHLISAAPELLKELKETRGYVVLLVDAGSPLVKEQLQRIDAAIAKAEGK
jgi:hypothetical protein